MQNVEVRIEGTKLIVEVDLTSTEGAITKGGNLMLATTGNWVKIDGRPDLSMNLVVVKSNRRQG